MAFNYDKVYLPSDELHVVLPDSARGVKVGGHYIYGHRVRQAGGMIYLHLLAGDNEWKHGLSLPRLHARALAYLLLLETAGPLERAAVIADARAEGIEIGGITSGT